MEEVRILAFLGVVVVVAAAVPFVAVQVRRRGSGQVERALESVRTQGFAVEAGASQAGFSVVRIWGLLPHPVAFDLRVARRSRFSRMAGSASAGMLDPLFEAAFRIQSAEPDRARLILEPELQRQLLERRRIELRLGSFESLLPREYGNLAGAAEDRRLRRLWMMRVPGRVEKLADAESLGALGAQLAVAVAKHALPPGKPDRASYETGPGEGWI